MLYIVHHNGSIEELGAAISAEVEEASGNLVCRDEAGMEVARYPGLAVIMYSKKPLPHIESLPGVGRLPAPETGRISLN